MLLANFGRGFLKRKCLHFDWNIKVPRCLLNNKLALVPIIGSRRTGLVNWRIYMYGSFSLRELITQVTVLIIYQKSRIMNNCFLLIVSWNKIYHRYNIFWNINTFIELGPLGSRVYVHLRNKFINQFNVTPLYLKRHFRMNVSKAWSNLQELCLMFQIFH